MNNDNVLNFRKPKDIIEPPSGPNWLSQLDQGTIFLTRPKTGKGFELVTCEVISFSPSRKGALVQNTGMEESDSGRGPVRVKVMVDTANFSAMMDLVEIIAINVGPEKEQEDGQGDRPEQGPGVSDAGDAQGLDKPHAEQQP